MENQTIQPEQGTSGVAIAVGLVAGMLLLLSIIEILQGFEHPSSYDAAIGIAGVVFAVCMFGLASVIDNLRRIERHLRKELTSATDRPTQAVNASI